MSGDPEIVLRFELQIQKRIRNEAARSQLIAEVSETVWDQVRKIAQEELFRTEG